MTWIKRKVNDSVETYGITGTALIILGIVALSPIPFPGTSLIPIAVAKYIKRRSA